MGRLITFLTTCCLLAACSPSQKDTLRVCNGSDCTERPTDYSSYDPEARNPEGNARQSQIGPEHLKALEDLAREKPKAAHDLALRYFRGQGVTQDSYQALTWMRRAGKQGNLQAQKALGRMYLTGLQEMGADFAEAERWLNAAASQGDTESAKLLRMATAARQDHQALYEWREEWRPYVYRFWSRRMAYYWQWRDGRWHHHNR